MKTGYWRTERPSRKLDNTLTGPYKIIEKVGTSYRVDIPSSMKIHNVFHAEKLRLSSDDPLPGQHNDPPPPIVIIGQQEYVVEKILASKALRGRM